MPAGRPSKFKPEYCELAYKAALLGAKDSQLADFFEVSESTIHKWKIDHPKFSESIKKGKEKADAEIAQSLFHRAKGYQCKEIKREQLVVDGKVVEGAFKETVTEKHHPPETAAIAFWLKNRQTALWRDKQEIHHTADPVQDMFDRITDRTRGLPSDTDGSLKH